MTTIYLALGWTYGPLGLIEDHDWKLHPISLLDSYAYIHKSLHQRVHKETSPENWMLDSGAYTIWNSGGTVDIDALIEETKNPFWNETVCLDAIGDEKKSVENALYMKAAGSPAYPVFHFGESWDTLKLYLENFDKVGLSCRFGEKRKDSIRWLEQCFARGYPKKFHSFGWIDKEALLSFPFHSGDACTWSLKLAGFGTSISRGNVYLGIRGSKLRHCFESEVLHYCELQALLRARWKKEIERWQKP